MRAPMIPICLVAICLGTIASVSTARAQDAGVEGPAQPIEDAGPPAGEPPGDGSTDAPATEVEDAEAPPAAEGEAARDDDPAEVEPQEEEEEEPVPDPDQLDFEPFEQVEEGEPTIEEVEASLAPTPYRPEFRIRVGGGVSLATAGPSGVHGRTTQEFEWQPPSLGFLLFGLGVAEMFPQYPTVQVGLRAGGYATFCETIDIRCTGTIAIQVGVIAGALGSNAGFDFSADADLRFLFSNVLELHLRGGFFSFEMQSFVDITGGIGFAF